MKADVQQHTENEYNESIVKRWHKMHTLLQQFRCGRIEDCRSHMSSMLLKWSITTSRFIDMHHKDDEDQSDGMPSLHDSSSGDEGVPTQNKSQALDNDTSE